MACQVTRFSMTGAHRESRDTKPSSVDVESCCKVTREPIWGTTESHRIICEGLSFPLTFMTYRDCQLRNCSHPPGYFVFPFHQSSHGWRAALRATCAEVSKRAFLSFCSSRTEHPTHCLRGKLRKPFRSDNGTSRIEFNSQFFAGSLTWTSPTLRNSR